MNTKILLGLTVWLMSISAIAADKQIWACRTANDGADPIIHLVEWGSRSYVKFAHLRFSAAHQLDGESQGWYFNNDGSGYYRYGLVLDSDGKAWYHDFSNVEDGGLSAPLDYFLCSRNS